MKIRNKLYAQALWEVIETQKSQEVDKIVHCLDNFLSIYQQETLLQQILKSPYVSFESKEKLIHVFCRVLQAEKIVTNFIVMLLKQKQTDQLSNIIQEFKWIRDERGSTMTVTIRTAVPVSSQHKKEGEQVLQQVFHKENVEWEEILDEQILGGVILETKEYIIDASVRRKIQFIGNALRSI